MDDLEIGYELLDEQLVRQLAQKAGQAVVRGAKAVRRVASNLKGKLGGAGKAAASQAGQAAAMSGATQAAGAVANQANKPIVSKYDLAARDKRVAASQAARQAEFQKTSDAIVAKRNRLHNKLGAASPDETETARNLRKRNQIRVGNAAVRMQRQNIAANAPHLQGVTPRYGKFWGQKYVESLTLDLYESMIKY